MVGDRMDTDVISRNGKWYVYCIGSLWMFNEGYTQNLCLSSDNGIEWSGRYRQYGKSKKRNSVIRQIPGGKVNDET